MTKIEETLTDKYTFQRKGNENQYKHEVKVLNKLKEANTNLEVPELNFGSIQVAKMKTAEYIELVQDRQKLIKLSDSSELGWKVVNEYIANPIADDSEDEKKVIKAQNRIERKNKAEKTKRGKSLRKVPYSKDKQEPRTSSWKPERYFNCGKKGHWADECPEKKKISTFNNFSVFDNNLLFDDVLQTNKQTKNKTDMSSNFVYSLKVNIVLEKHVKWCIEADSFRGKCSKLSLKIPVSPFGQLRAHLNEWESITNNKHIRCNRKRV